MEPAFWFSASSRTKNILQPSVQTNAHPENKTSYPLRNRRVGKEWAKMKMVFDRKKKKERALREFLPTVCDFPWEKKKAIALHE